jgi:hypothetical protein
MRVVERSGRAYTETLEGTTNLRIYGPATRSWKCSVTQQGQEYR